MKPHVLALGARGRVLGTRKLGIELASELRESVATGASTVLIDFAGVEVASSPVLDEIVCAVRAAVADYPGHHVVLANLNEDVNDTMRLVLQRRSMGLATLEGERLTLLGGRKHLEETLDAAQELGTFTASQLAERLKLKLPNLHQRLVQLEAGGAVTRVASPESGRAHCFAAPPSAAELVRCQ